tara:strand:- start:299 stop:1063 length:765 start_codon:yes stop_codon:yes gene_type:complete
MSILNNINIIYSDIKNTYQKRYQEGLKILNAFLIILGIRVIIIGLNNLFINNQGSLQYIIFYLSTSLLIIGLEVGMIKLLFNSMDQKIKSQYEIFNYFYLLKKYFLGLFLFYFIMGISLLPGLIYIIIRSNYEIFNIIQNSLDDIYFQQLISSYFNEYDLLIIILLILIPAIYSMVRLCFWNYCLIDKNISGLSAILKSFKITRKKELEIILYFFIFLILNIIGILTILGMLFTIPMTYLFFAKYYRLLNQDFK